MINKEKSICLVLVSVILAGCAVGPPPLKYRNSAFDGSGSFHYGGCATLVEIKKEDGVKPRFISHKHGNMGSGSDVGMLGLVAGAGVIASAAVGAVVAGVANANMNSANGDKNAGNMTYLVTMKPDFGTEFTIDYSFGADPAVPSLFTPGTRVRYGGYPKNPNQTFNLELSKMPVYESINDPKYAVNKIELDNVPFGVDSRRNEEKYLIECYGYPNVGIKQLVYDWLTRYFEWQDPPEVITQVMDTWQ